MADESNVNILMNVDIDASDTLKNMAELRQRTLELREEQKQLDKTTAEGREEYERLNTQIKANNKTVQQYERQIINAMTQEKAQNGSIKSLRAELSNAKAAYAALSREERENAKGRDLLDKTSALNAELKELESAYGDNQRKVGEYEIAGKSLRRELREVTEELQRLALAGQEGSDAYNELSLRASELVDVQGDVNAQLRQMSSDTVVIDTTLQGVQALIASYGAWKSAAVALGIENEALEKTVQRVIALSQVLQSLQTLQNLAQKQSNLYRSASLVLQKLGIKQTTAETVAKSANVAAIQAEAAAENASTAAKMKGVVATKAVTAAQWLWNAAMSANPVMLLVIAMAAAVAGIAALVGWLNKESGAAKDARIAQEAYNTALEESEVRLRKLETAHKNNVRAVQLSTRETVEALKRQQADTQTIRDIEEIGQTKLRELEIEYQRQRTKESQDLIALKQKELTFLVAAQEQTRKGSKAWKEYTEKIKDARAAVDDLKVALDDANFSIRETMQEQVEADREAAESAKKAAKEKADAAKTALDARITAYEKELEAQRKYNEAYIKAEKAYQNTDFRTKQAYARRLFDLNAESERAKLDNLRKNNRITEAEYQKSLGIMAAELTAFNNAQAAELTDFYKSERDAIVGMIAQTLDEQIVETEKRYAEALEKLGKLEGDAALDRIQTAIRLEDQKNKEIEALRKANIANRIKQVEDENDEAFASDLAKYQDNERARLDVLEKSLRAQIDAKKAAGLETYDEESRLQSVSLQRNALNLNKELLLADKNAKKIRDAKVNALNEQLGLYEDNADKQLEIAKEIADAERELIDARIEQFAEWRNAAAELLDGFNALLSTGLDKQLQKVQETYDAESLALASKHAQGVFTEAQYNLEVLKMEKQREKDEAKIERQRAIRERAGKVFSVVTDTAMGIVKAVAASPLTGGLPWSTIVGAIGALNLATILSEPLPKAAQGGLISGPSHARGGTVIEAEGGEAIMTRKAVSMFGPLLSAINALGGGVPFAAPLSDGGYTLRSTGQTGVTADEIAAALQGVKIVTLVEDINRGQQNLNEVLSASSV